MIYLLNEKEQQNVNKIFIKVINYDEVTKVISFITKFDDEDTWDDKPLVSYYFSDDYEFVKLFYKNDLYRYVNYSSTMLPFKNSTNFDKELVKERNVMNSTKEYTGSLIIILYRSQNGNIYIKGGNSILVEMDDGTKPSETDVTAGLGTFIGQIEGDAEKLRFKKMSAEKYNAPIWFYNKMQGFGTPIGSYLDLETDMVMNFMKFLYNKNDNTIMEFFSQNEKYKLIMDEAIAGIRNTVDNKSDSTIQHSFKRKEHIQNGILEYKNILKQIQDAKTEDELPVLEQTDYIG